MPSHSVQYFVRRSLRRVQFALNERAADFGRCVDVSVDFADANFVTAVPIMNIEKILEIEIIC